MSTAECCICFDPLFTHIIRDPDDGSRDERPLAAPACGHVLHHDCWMSCLASTGACPVCRAKPQRPKKDLVFQIHLNGRGSAWPDVQDPVASVKGKANKLKQTVRQLGVDSTADALEGALGVKGGLAAVLLDINKLTAEHWSTVAANDELSTLLSDLVAVYASLYSKLHYTHINSSLKTNVQALERQVDEHKTELRKQAAQHADKLEAVRSAAEERVKRKEDEFRTGYYNKMQEKKKSWATTEQQLTTSVANLDRRRVLLLEEKKKVESELAGVRASEEARLRTCQTLSQQVSKLQKDAQKHKSDMRVLQNELVLAKANQHTPSSSRKRARMDDYDDQQPASDPSSELGVYDESLEVEDESFSDVVFANPARPTGLYRTSSNASKPLQPSTSFASNRAANSASVFAAPKAPVKVNSFSSGPRSNPAPAIAKQARPVASGNPFGSTGAGRVPLLHVGEKQRRKAVI